MRITMCDNCQRVCTDDYFNLTVVRDKYIKTDRTTENENASDIVLCPQCNSYLGDLNSRELFEHIDTIHDETCATLRRSIMSLSNIIAVYGRTLRDRTST